MVVTSNLKNEKRKSTAVDNFVFSLLFFVFLVKKLCKFGVFFGPVGGYELLALNTYNKKAMH